jgi:type IV conjugative transfer system protein TraL
MEEIEIPNSIDERLFVMWEMEETLTALITFMVVANFVNIFLGLVFAYLGFRAMRVFKARQPKGAIIHWLYWNGLLPLHKTRMYNGLEREVFGK